MRLGVLRLLHTHTFVGSLVDTASNMLPYSIHRVLHSRQWNKFCRCHLEKLHSWQDWQCRNLGRICSMGDIERWRT